MTSIYIYKEKFRPSDKLIKIICISRLVFGTYSEVCSNFYVSTTIKLYCVIVMSCLIYYGGDVMTLQNLTDYVVISILSIISKDQHFSVYVSKMKVIDDELDFRGDFMEGHVSFYIFFVLMIMKYSSLASFIIWYVPFAIPLKVHLILMYSSWSLSICHFPGIIMFEMLWHRIKYLRKMLKCTLVSFRVKNKKLIQYNVKMTIHYLMIYSKLIRNLNDTGNTPKILVIFFYLLIYIIYVYSFHLLTKYVFLDFL